MTEKEYTYSSSIGKPRGLLKLNNRSVVFLINFSVGLSAHFELFTIFFNNPHFFSIIAQCFLFFSNFHLI